MQHVKPRSVSHLIYPEDKNEYNPKIPTPDGGMYDAHLKPFGADITQNAVTMGSKYVFKPDSNPPVGGYDTERGYNAIKFRNQETLIKPPTSPYRRPKEQNPAPG